MSQQDKDIELPPLPSTNLSIEFDNDRLKACYEESVWTKAQMESYARQAIAQDRQQRENKHDAWIDMLNFEYERGLEEGRQQANQQRGEPDIERRVYKNTKEYSQYLSARFDRKNGTMNSFEWDGHRWAYKYTSFDDAGDYDLIYRPAPQPAEPVEDKGPWHSGITQDGKRHFVESDDFTHDVRLYVDGDFADDTQKAIYTKSLAAKLNAEPAALTECGLWHNLRTLDPVEKSEPVAKQPLAGDERKAFEAWAKVYFSGYGWNNPTGQLLTGRYTLPKVQEAWETWQARAALS